MPREPMSSGRRAPVDSPRNTSGMPRSVAMRFMCPILLPLVAPVEAPFTVKSLTTTATSRPSILPKPAILPSAGVSSRSAGLAEVPNRPDSMKLPGSSSAVDALARVEHARGLAPRELLGPAHARAPPPRARRTPSRRSARSSSGSAESAACRDALMRRLPGSAWRLAEAITPSPASVIDLRVGRPSTSRSTARVSWPTSLAGVADGARRLRQARHDAGHRDAAEVLVGRVDDRAARPVVRIGEDVGDGVDARRRHARPRSRMLLERRPAACAAVQRADDRRRASSWFSMRARGRREARVVGELRLAHRRRQAAEQAVGHRGDVDEAAVAGRIEVVRRALRQARAGAVGDEAQLLVGGDPRLHEAEGAFVERGVDALAAPGLAARQQRHHGAEGGVAGR